MTLFMSILNTGKCSPLITLEDGEKALLSVSRYLIKTMSLVQALSVGSEKITNGPDGTVANTKTVLSVSILAPESLL